MDITTQLINELNKFGQLLYLPSEIIKIFIERTNKGSIVKKGNAIDHFCTMFLPYNRQTNSMYLIHHKKANDWIAPGGHMEENELPINTLTREFTEELNYNLTHEKIEPLYLCSIPLTHPAPGQTCRIHYDFWYLVHTELIDFKYDKKEFYGGKWYTIEEALNKMKQPVYLPILAILHALKSHQSPIK